ncbi:MAG: cell division protein ZapD [Rhodocyclaceae bacterium]|nr:cell division protein ZapD [Rhodocyclaceae bacterium]
MFRAEYDNPLTSDEPVAGYRVPRTPCCVETTSALKMGSSKATPSPPPRKSFFCCDSCYLSVACVMFRSDTCENGAESMHICGNVQVPLRYEFPLTERVRLLLRLEDSLRRIAEQAHESSPDAHRYALMALCELVELTLRIDLKSEVRNEAERQRNHLRALRRSPEADPDLLEGALSDLDQVVGRIDGSTHRAGARCRDDGWLAMVRARTALPGGVTRFDMPSFNFWSALDPVKRRDRLLDWLGDFACVQEGVVVVLRLLRACAETASQQAQGGQFQRPLGPRQPLLVGVDMAPDAVAIPEVSANRLALLIRFNQLGAGGRPRPFEDAIAFGLAVTYSC